jgi:SusD family.
MNKNILYIVLFAGILFSSCNDFLKEDPKGKLTAETYFATQQELDMSMYALYQKVNNTQIYTNMQYPQWQGDDITANPGSNKQACAEMDKFAVTNNNKGVRDSWNMHYNLVKAANYIILNAERTPTTKEEINIAIGNAKFWRAYAYFYLVRLYGPLPLNLDNVNDDYTRELSSVEEVYAQILKDLEDAEKVLPVNYSGAPRSLFGVNVYVTEPAVKSTLSAVYMAMAGYPLNKADYYAKAAAKAKEVIDGVKGGKYNFALDKEYKNVYSMGNNYNNETVLGINYSPFGDWSQDSELTSCCLFESLGGWGDAWGEIRFWKRFPDGPRKAATYDPKLRVEVTETVNGKDEKKVIFRDWWEHLPERHPMFSVFTVNIDNGVNVAAPYDYTLPPSRKMCNDHRHRLIRYSEVLLWYAEAKARSGAADDLARQCLRDVRTRAVEQSEINVVNGVSIDAMSADQLAEAAYDEHGWEVAGYWVALVTRRADQFRMNRLKETFAERAANNPIEVAPGVTVTESVELTNKSWNDNLMYLPYPEADSQKNPNLVR